MKKFFALAAVAALAMTASAQSLYLTGACATPGEEGCLPANWAPETPAEFEVVDGNYVVTVKGLQQFKISTVKGTWDDWNTAAYGCNYPEETGVWAPTYEASAESPNTFCPWEGDWTVTVKGDLSEMMLTTTTPKPADEGIKLYFRGDMNGWGADEEWMFTQVSDNVFKYEFDADHSVELGMGFKIADSTWGKYNFGGNNEAVMLEVETELYSNGANISLEEPCNGVCWFAMTEDGNYVAFSNDKDYVPEFANVDDSAVNEVAVATEAPVYFNLQGVKVANPANGIYVVVKGGKAYKTVVK